MPRTNLELGPEMINLSFDTSYMSKKKILRKFTDLNIEYNNKLKKKMEPEDTVESDTDKLKLKITEKRHETNQKNILP